MTSPFYFTDREIRKVTKYIKDDRYIASIYGCSTRRVRMLREKGSRREPDYSGGPPIGMDCVARDHASIAKGTAELLKSIMRERERCVG